MDECELALLHRVGPEDSHGRISASFHVSDSCRFNVKVGSAGVEPGPCKHSCPPALVNIGLMITGREAASSERWQPPAACISKKRMKKKASANKREASFAQRLTTLRDAAFTFDPVKHLPQELHNKSQQGSSLCEQAPSSQLRGPGSLKSWRRERKKENH